MPYTERQKRYFGAELGRMKRGEATETGMTHNQLVEGIHSPTRKKKKKKRLMSMESESAMIRRHS